MGRRDSASFNHRGEPMLPAMARNSSALSIDSRAGIYPQKSTLSTVGTKKPAKKGLLSPFNLAVVNEFMCFLQLSVAIMSTFWRQDTSIVISAFGIFALFRQNKQGFILYLVLMLYGIMCDIVYLSIYGPYLTYERESTIWIVDHNDRVRHNFSYWMSLSGCVLKFVNLVPALMLLKVWPSEGWTWNILDSIVMPTEEEISAYAAKLRESGAFEEVSRPHSPEPPMEPIFDTVETSPVPPPKPAGLMQSARNASLDSIGLGGMMDEPSIDIPVEAPVVAPVSSNRNSSRIVAQTSAMAPVKEGVLLKQGKYFNNTFKPKFFKLKDGWFHYFTHQKAALPKVYFSCKNCTISSIEENKRGTGRYLFMIDNDIKPLMLCAESARARDEWIQEFRKSQEWCQVNRQPPSQYEDDLRRAASVKGKGKK